MPPKRPAGPRNTLRNYGIRPKAKARPATRFNFLRRVQRRRNMRRPNHISTFNAMVGRHRAVPVPGVMGDYLTTPTLVRNGINAVAGGVGYVVVQWTPSNLVGIMIGSDRTITEILDTTLAESAPTTVRPLAKSFHMRNTTQYTNIQGSVRVLCTANQLQWDMEAGDLKISTDMETALTNLFASSTETKSYTAADFLTTRTFIMAPAAQDAYKENALYGSVTTPAERTAALKTGADRGPMNVLIVQINKATPDQAYDYSIASQVATRHPANTLYAALQRPSRVVAESRWHRMVQQAQRVRGAALG